MKKLKGIVKFVIVGVVYQVVAYVIAKILVSIMNIVPPYSYLPEGFNTSYTHMTLSWVALLLALYSYPTDLDK